MGLLKVLVIEYQDDSYALVHEQLRQAGYPGEQIIRCSCAAGISQLSHSNFQVILADFTLPDSPYREAFNLTLQKFPTVPIIILSEQEITGLGLKAIHEGAQDFIVKQDLTPRFLSKAIQYAIERKNITNDYKSLFADSPGPMYIYDKHSYRFLAVNTAALKQYGYTREEFLSMSGPDIRPEAEVAAFMNIQEQMTSSYFDGGQWRHRRRNGEVFYVHIYAHNTVFEGREAVVALAIDVDKKVRTEQRNRELNYTIKQQKEQLDLILSSIPEVIWSRRADDFSLTFINGAAEKVYGYTAEELMGTLGVMENGIYPDDREALERAAEEVFRTGKAACEYRIIHRDGSIRHLFGEALYIKSDGNGPDLISGIAFDITEQRQYLAQIEEQNRKLLEVAQIQSHQLRGPVASILGLASLFNFDDLIDPANAEVVYQLQQAAHILDHNIRAITGFIESPLAP